MKCSPACWLTAVTVPKHNWLLCVSTNTMMRTQIQIPQYLSSRYMSEIHKYTFFDVTHFSKSCSSEFRAWPLSLWELNQQSHVLTTSRYLQVIQIYSYPYNLANTTNKQDYYWAVSKWQYPNDKEVDKLADHCLRRAQLWESGEGKTHIGRCQVSQVCFCRLLRIISAPCGPRYHWYHVDQVSGGKLCSLSGIRYLWRGYLVPR